MASTTSSNKVALITGGASGIGKAAATFLARDGYIAVLGDIDEKMGPESVAEIEAQHGKGKAAFVKLDVGSEESWRKAVEFCATTFGGLHVLVNNAGIGGLRVSVEETELVDFERVMKITSTSVFLGCKVAAPELFKNPGQASVVNVASMMANVGGFGKNPAYFSAKGSVRTLTKNIALSWASKGVRVNSVNPGYIDTPLLKKRGGDNEDRFQRLRDLTPLGRLGTSEEIAEVICFLAGEKSTFCTGAEFVCDGGYTAQ